MEFYTSLYRSGQICHLLAYPMPFDDSRAGITKCITDPFTNYTEAVYREILANLHKNGAEGNAYGIADVVLTGANVLCGIVNMFIYKLLLEALKRARAHVPEVCASDGHMDELKKRIVSTRPRRETVYVIENK